MAVRSKHVFSRSRTVQSVQRYVEELIGDGLIWHTSPDAAGRSILLEGRECLNFGSCSYLGLHLHPDLAEGTIAAVRRYGTQFPFSRAYMSSSLYLELEEMLGRITGRHALVGASTTLVHLAALPVLVDDEDAVVIDQFAHASLYSATEHLGRTPVVRVRHGRVDLLENLIKELSATHKRVWYVLDGLYSMRGDFAPFAALKELLGRYPALHLYVDDAHSTSWYGTHGRGAALTHLPDDDRVVVALSLNKAFAAAGGAVVVSNPALKRKIRTCGGTMMFSGPIQAPMLGAAVASARLHLSPELGRMQVALREKIDHARAQATQVGVNVVADDPTPIFQLPYDSSVDARQATHAFWKAGFYVCPVSFPAVPMSTPGIRFTVCASNELEDIRAFFDVAKRVDARDVARRGKNAARSQPVAVPTLR